MASPSDQELPPKSSDAEHAAIIFGTSHNSFPGGEQEVFASCMTALRCGVRKFDTATRYGSEGAVGRALKAFSEEEQRADANGPLVEIEVTTKLWPGHAASGDYNAIKNSFVSSCVALQVDSLAMYLVHWPGLGDRWGGKSNREGREDSWRALERIVEADGSDEGVPRLKNIGVSNYTTAHLQEMEDYASILPCVNQIELNPFQQATDIREYCDKCDIGVQAYSPLGKGEILSDPDACRIGRQLGLSTAQVFVQWCFQKGAVPVVASRDPEHIREIADCGTFRSPFIPADDMALLDRKHIGLRVTWDSSHVP